MFTIKLYRGSRQRILSAESFTILRNDPHCDEATPQGMSSAEFARRNAISGGAEITLHMKNPNDDVRYDIGEWSRDSVVPQPVDSVWPEMFDKAIIENAAGKTTEIIALSPLR